MAKSTPFPRFLIALARHGRDKENGISVIFAVSRTGKRGSKKKIAFWDGARRYFGKVFLGKLLMVLPFAGFWKFRFH